MGGESRGSGRAGLNRKGREEDPQRTPGKPLQIQIRLAGPEDAAAIAAVLHESFLEYESLYTKGGFAATTPGAEQMHARMREGPLWIALRGGEVLGTVAAVRKDDSAYIRGMAVLPLARGSGVGSRLLEQVEHWASREGVRRLFLSTTPFLDSAIRLYEKSGFVRSDEGPHELFGTPLFTMEKAVARAK